MKNSTRFLLTLAGLAVASGAVSAALPIYVLENADFRAETILAIYLWPGAIFGLFIGLYLQSKGVFEAWRGWAMIPVSTLSFPITLYVGELFDDKLGLAEEIAIPLGCLFGSLVFMAGAAALSRVYRHPLAVILGGLAGGLAMLAATLFGAAFPGFDWWVVATVVTFWQVGFALTLGGLALWRARQAR